MNDLYEPNRDITASHASSANNPSSKAVDSMLHRHDIIPPTKKRKCEEFTISQKLSILHELRTQNLSVPALAQKHNTSRTTIYRWRKEEPRLNRLKRSNADSKRVSLSAASSSSLSGKPMRKSYNDEFTAEQKLEVLRECRDNPLAPVREIAERYGTHVRSVYRWKKREERLKLLVDEDKAHVKRSPKDGLHRVKSAILRHFSGEKVSGAEIARKAKEVRDELLGEHQISPFLSEGEVRALREFTASSSWGRKLVVKLGWKEGGRERGEDEEEEKADGGLVRQMQPRERLRPLQPHWGSGQPSELTLRLQQPIQLPAQSYAPPQAQVGEMEPTKELKIKEEIKSMKKEINALKRKIGRLQKRNEVLESENGWLKQRAVGHYSPAEEQQVVNQDAGRDQHEVSLLPQSVHEEGDGVNEEFVPFLG